MMKKATLLLSLLFVIPCSMFAQDNDSLPVIHFGTFEQFGPQDVSVAQILADPQFYVKTEGCKIKSFDISGAAIGKEYIGPYTSKGEKLSPSQISYIKSLDEGSQVWFNNIQVKCKDKNYTIGKDGTAFSIYFFNIL